ncbi:MAG: hypothetical protein AB7V53_00415 [Dongiaceae bacterium]
MDGTGRWIAGGAVAILGVIGLFLAAGAADRGIYLFGLALFAFAILYVFALIKQAFDTQERDVKARRLPSAAE